MPGDPAEIASDAAPRPTIGVTAGDPLGVGPEIVVKALADPALRRLGRFVVYGSTQHLRRAAEQAGIEPYWWRVPHDSDLIDVAIGHSVLIRDYDDLVQAGAPGESKPRPTRAGGAASFRFVEDAIADAQRPAGDARRLDAIVTAPISKQSWSLAGRGKYGGHTELLATRFGARRVAMMFVSPRLRVILATVHIPLMDLRNVLTLGRVFEPIDLGNEACRALGVARPRIAVCGLNPHAGEHGLFGDEETRLIEPAIRMAVDAGIDARGPFPADTVFIAAAEGAYDLVVAMYHDQGLIPVKLLDWRHAVNMTVGLPTVRTSPDHGTAFDIAGRNRADATSMREAISLACRSAAHAMASATA